MVSFVSVGFLIVYIGEEFKWQFDRYLVFLTIVFSFSVLIFGCFIGFLTGCFVLPLLIKLRDKINGAPFRVGDEIIILGGKDMGKTGIVSIVIPTENRYILKMSDTNGVSYERVISYAKIKRTNAAEQLPGTDK